MSKEEIKKEFLEEIELFSKISKRDLAKGFTIEQVEDELIKFSSAFYGSRLDFDDYAVKKCYFIATYVYQIIKGNFNDEKYMKEFNEYLEEFYNDISADIKK